MEDITIFSHVEVVTTVTREEEWVTLWADSMAAIDTSTTSGLVAHTL